MIVIDASATVEFLVRRGDRGDWVAEQLAEANLAHAPHLLDTEVVSALRGYVAGGKIPVRAAEAALGSLASMPILRYPAYPVLERIWALRHSLTAFDATYVALAEALGVPLVTTDARLARSTGHRALVTAFPG